MLGTITRIEFVTTVFQSAHGKMPRGRGSWAFHPDANVDSSDSSIIWYSGMYTDAKAFARQVAYERGWDTLVVLS